MDIPLFIVEPTRTCMLQIRRFQYGTDTNGHRHDTTVTIDYNTPVLLRKPDDTRFVQDSDDRVPRDDPRWPAACACGYLWQDTDRWQVNEVEWYEGGGQRFAWGIGNWDGPPGAMIRSIWRDQPDRPPAYLVFLPNGRPWNTNDRAYREGDALGPYWTVAGEAPMITVTPSIDDRSSRPWHGWVRNGMLVEA